MRSNRPRPLSSKRSTAVAMLSLLPRWLGLRFTRTNGHIVQAYTQQAKERQRSQDRLSQPLPDGVAPGNLRVLGQSPVEFRPGGIMQHVNHVCAADGLRIVNAGVLISEVFAELLGALLGDELHVFLAAELQAARGTRLDASRLQPLAHTIGAERAFVDLFCGLVELRYVERATGDAELAANAVLLVEVHDSIGVLHDRAVSRTGAQAAGIGAVHALVLAHQPLDGAVFALVLVELDEIPKAPRARARRRQDRKSTRLNSSHVAISYAVFCLKKKTNKTT